MKICFLKLVTLLIFVANVAFSAGTINVTKSGAGKSVIDISGLNASGSNSAISFRDTLANDLRLSGWFKVLSGGKGSIVITGSCSDSGKYLTVKCRVSNRASGKVYLNDSFNDKSANARKLAHTVADRIVYKLKGVKGIASTRMVMIGAKGTKKDIFICDYDGGNMLQVTKDGAVCLSPSWGPDAKSIVYTAFIGGFPDIYKIDLVVNKRNRIANYPGLNSGADISPDGKSMALILSKDGNPDLYVKDLRSGRLTRLTKTRHAVEASPSWSPDGRNIVFVSDGTGIPRLHVIDRRGGGKNKITFRLGEDVAPDWGLDGHIAYSKKSGGLYIIHVLDIKTGESTAVSPADADYEDPAWAPDGRHIVCSRTVGYHSDLYILDILGDPPLRLTRLSGDWYSPSWSSK